jgi:hypothetical protein
LTVQAQTTRAARHAIAVRVRAVGLAVGVVIELVRAVLDDGDAAPHVGEALRIEAVDLPVTVVVAAVVADLAATIRRRRVAAGRRHDDPRHEERTDPPHHDTSAAPARRRTV